MSSTLLALLICLAGAALEGWLAGSGVRKRLASLRMPPFALWLVIGFANCAICFVVLRHLLAARATLSSALLVVVLLANALWNLVFFRWRNLRASWFAFIPYAALVVALVPSLARVYLFVAVLFMCYGAHLLYAAWWGYRLRLLNSR